MVGGSYRSTVTSDFENVSRQSLLVGTTNVES